MREGTALASAELTDPGGKVLSSRNLEIALSSASQRVPKTPVEDRKAGFTVLESAMSFETRGLPDGEYGLRVKMQSPGAEEERSCTVLFRGALTAENARRNAEVRKRISGMAIKFEFCQGFPIMKDASTHLPFIKAIKDRTFDAYEFMPHGYVWTEERFAVFEQFLKTAKEEGFPVWATLTPYPTHKSLTDLPDQGRSYYLKTVERFGELASQYDNFVGYTFDDFMYYLGYFTPRFIAQMTNAGRAKADSLIFQPLMYYPSITAQFFQDYGPYIDGIIFHYRAGSKPGGYIDGYDPSDFHDYADCMGAEMQHVRKLAGSEPVICGIYIWYTRGGWGVHHREGGKEFTEGDFRRIPRHVGDRHVAMDALLKTCIAHDYADGLRVYGLGIAHPAYAVMGAMVKYWKEKDIPWGHRVGTE